MPYCTIIVVNWNSWEYLFPCLDAVYEQSFQDFHVIVVDNASEDAAASERLKRYPRLTFVQNDTNVGFAAANNQAARMAGNCDWLVLLNPDTLPEKNWLQELCKASRDWPAFSFFGSHLVMAKQSGIIDGTGDVYHISGLCWRAHHGCVLSCAPKHPHEIFSPCAAAAMYKRKDFLAVNGFDEDFFCYNEDVDLGFRLRLAGGQALSVPTSIVKHHGSATTSIRSDFSVYFGHRNLVWTWVKDMPLILLWLFLPVHLGYTCACILLYLLRGQGRVILRAKWDALKELPKFITKRKAIHATSRITLAGLWRVMNKSLIIGPEKKYIQTR